MADGTHIQWTDATWQIITGCSVVSPGCMRCYAMKWAGTRLAHHPSRAGLTRNSKAGPVWTGDVRFNEKWLTQPLHWKHPRMIFVCAHGDLFHEAVPDEWIDRVLAVMALAPQHTFQVLTKRARRMRDYLSGDWSVHVYQTIEKELGSGIGCGWLAGGKPLPHVWFGVSVEDQTSADERIPDLLATPAAVRWVSAEPLLGPIDFKRCRQRDESVDAIAGEIWRAGCGSESSTTWRGKPKLDWIVVGGESGPGARPMHPDWARSIREQCAAAGVAFFFKQWGEWAPGEAVARAPTRTEVGAWLFREWTSRPVTLRESEQMCIDDEPDVWRVGKARAGRLLDGREHNDMPGVRE